LLLIYKPEMKKKYKFKCENLAEALYLKSLQYSKSLESGLIFKEGDII